MLWISIRWTEHGTIKDDDDDTFSKWTWVMGQDKNMKHVQLN